jgi:hypothetical protein
VWTVGIPVFAIGLAAGLLFRSVGFTIPLVYEVALWVGRDLTGGFANRSGNGDNFAAMGAIGVVGGFLLGALGVIAGISLRMLVQRLYRAR